MAKKRKAKKTRKAAKKKRARTLKRSVVAARRKKAAPRRKPAASLGSSDRLDRRRRWISSGEPLPAASMATARASYTQGRTTTPRRKLVLSNSTA